MTDTPQDENCNCPGPCTGACRPDYKMKSIFSRLEELSRIMQEEHIKTENLVEAKWNALSPQDQQDYFYAVVKRIHKGDVVDGGSYRYVLYDVFGWGPESYGMGMECNYLDLHNQIWNGDRMNNLMVDMANQFNLDPQELKEWFVKKHLL